MLKKKGMRAVITLADSSRHVGSIYQVCNFKYYGLNDKKCDFVTADGKITHRGKTNGLHGVFVERPRKHRYCYLIDKKLKVLHKECEYPKAGERSHPHCCGGTHKIYDNRFKEWYSCPVCCGYIQLLKDGEETPKYKIKNTNEYKDPGQLSLF
jgi:hypothetical protein